MSQRPVPQRSQSRELSVLKNARGRRRHGERRSLHHSLARAYPFQKRQCFAHLRVSFFPQYSTSRVSSFQQPMWTVESWNVLPQVYQVGSPEHARYRTLESLSYTQSLIPLKGTFAEVYIAACRWTLARARSSRVETCTRRTCFP